MSTAQVKVKLVTAEEDPSLQVPESALFVPVLLKRFGVSEIINYMLKKHNLRPDSAQPVPFDILINGNLLSGSLDDYLTAHGLSNEVLLTLEYKKARLPPTLRASYATDDWVLAVSISPDASGALEIMSGSYDGVVRVWNASGEVEGQFAGHLAPIQAVAWGAENRAVLAGNDRTLRLWRVKRGGATQAATEAILEGHQRAVNSLAVRDTKILSGGADGAVCLWLTRVLEMEAVTAQHDAMRSNLSLTAAQKRRKLALGDASIKRRMPLQKLEAHKQPVEAVLFDQDSTVAYSVSQDHSIKTWDLETLRAVSSASTGFSLLSAVSLPEAHLLACGSLARHILLHDPRAGGASVVRQLVGHTGFVVLLAKEPGLEYGLVSGSHDGTVRVWDIRGEKSVYSMKQDGKVLAVDWGKEGIVCGGEDKKVTILGQNES